jgi:hypothetical protein
MDSLTVVFFSQLQIIRFNYMLAVTGLNCSFIFLGVSSYGKFKWILKSGEFTNRNLEDNRIRRLLLGNATGSQSLLLDLCVFVGDEDSGVTTAFVRRRLCVPEEIIVNLVSVQWRLYALTCTMCLSQVLLRYTERNMKLNCSDNRYFSELL